MMSQSMMDQVATMRMTSVVQNNRPCSIMTMASVIERESSTSGQPREEKHSLDQPAINKAVIQDSVIISKTPLRNI